MRVTNLHVRNAMLAGLLLAASACQTAQKPVALLPPTTAPAIKAKPVAASQPEKPAAQTAKEEVPATEPQEPTQKPAATEPQAKEPAIAPDAVGELIAKTEKEYQAGLASYHAGDSEAAKKSFDNAFNLLLASEFDIRSDDRLQKEFDRIVTGVNALGLGAPPQQPATNEAEQKSEPAPIDEASEAAPTADPNVKAKAQLEIKSTRSDLPLMMTDQVAGYISYFSNRGRGTFERAFARSGRYRAMMLPILKQEGVPQDLIYLAQAESGFHPLAVSRVGARGIWQFMGSRARGYGLSHNQWVDDRQDPEKSTRAAARHLKDLYNQFGDWYLAMAAYNSGPGTVQAAVKRTGYADFWELYRRNVLPKETRNYVPIIVAMTIVSKNLSQYGFDDVSMEEPAKYDTVVVNYPVDLRLVAECVDSTPVELQELNPGLLRMTTPREGSYELRLPAGKKDQYTTAIADVPKDMRLWWRYHKVQQGDTLTSLARSYHTTAKAIEDANHLEDADIQPDAKLIIPVAPGKHPVSDTATYARRITRYKVRRGDTVETVAENFGLSPQMVRRWNGLRGNGLQGRRVLALHLPVSPSASHTEEVASRKSKRTPKPTQTSATKAPASNTALKEKIAPKAEAEVVHHKVKSGETLYSIATYYKTTVAALQRDNRNVAVLHPGMILTVQSAR